MSSFIQSVFILKSGRRLETCKLYINMVSSLSKKRCQDVNAISEKANIVLIDIEGTTTSISFVKVIHLFVSMACNRSSHGAYIYLIFAPFKFFFKIYFHSLLIFFGYIVRNQQYIYCPNMRIIRLHKFQEFSLSPVIFPFFFYNFVL